PAVPSRGSLGRRQPVTSRRPPRSRRLRKTPTSCRCEAAPTSRPSSQAWSRRRTSDSCLGHRRHGRLSSPETNSWPPPHPRQEPPLMPRFLLPVLASALLWVGPAPSPSAPPPPPKVSVRIGSKVADLSFTDIRYLNRTL